jgi:hypothetical protein
MLGTRLEICWKKGSVGEKCMYSTHLDLGLLLRYDSWNCNVALQTPIPLTPTLPTLTLRNPVVSSRSTRQVSWEKECYLKCGRISNEFSSHPGFRMHRPIQVKANGGSLLLISGGPFAQLSSLSPLRAYGATNQRKLGSTRCWKTFYIWCPRSRQLR